MTVNALCPRLRRIRRWRQVSWRDLNSFFPTSIRKFAASVGSKILPEKRDKKFIDFDTEKLCSHVCINYFVEGEEPGPKILPDSEYPSWLFELDLKRQRPFEDMDPEKDGWLYWRQLRKL
ncbi:unnamed protein product [Dracunculus medinensis]|uniref:Large ribosomal subunit protein mL54 n=1 Tax=Dracunculus medinensis TaxID=318479 RepID=A0A0N4UEK1_DRAME|nr:unnamed protein product [Dracunculus medinensis]